MLKKIMSLTLAFITALNTFGIPTFAADSPSPSSWAEAQVNTAIAAKLVPQSLQSKYTQATTRAEFCALAVAVYETTMGKTITGRTTFSDTSDVNVEKAAAISVVSGVGNNHFDPDAKLTREQAAAMLARLADSVGKPFAKQAATFADNSSVSSWALESVGLVQGAGIMGGVGNNTFAPQEPYTREQSIITIMRMYDTVRGETELAVQQHSVAAQPSQPVMTASQPAKTVASYYEMGQDKIPSIEQALGKEFTLIGDEETTKVKAVLRKISYTTSGKELNRDMFVYSNYLRENDGFYRLEDIDFSGSSGSSIIGRNSVEEGYEIQLQIAYEANNFTLSILKQPGEITLIDPTLDEADTTLLRGLWRIEDNTGVALYLFRQDGTFLAQFFANDSSDDEVTSGKYRISGESLIMSELTFNGIEEEDEFLLPFTLDGDTVTINGDEFVRVAAQDVAAVLADPVQQYPLVSSIPGAKTAVLTKEIMKTMADGKYHLKLHMIADENYPDSIDFDCYVQDGVAAMTMEVMGMPVRMVYQGGKGYTIFDELKMIAVEPAELVDKQPLVADTSLLTFVGEKMGRFQGKIYQCDEYTNTTGMHLLYFVDNGELIGIRTIKAEGETRNVAVYGIDTKIPPGIFDIPKDYEVEEW